MKKASELSTLCGINVCLIIYPPQSEEGEPETWPKDQREVIRSIEKYNDKKKSQKKPRKPYDLHEFFKDRKTQIQSETSKVRERRLRMSYPTWDESFDNLGEEKLRMLIGSLDSKIEECNQRIEFTKMEKAKKSEIVPVTPTNSGTGLMQNMSQGNLFTHPMMPLVDSNPLQSQMLPFVYNYDLNFPVCYDNIGGVQSVMQPFYEFIYDPALESIAFEDLMYDEAVFQNGFKTEGYYDSVHASL